MATLGVTTVALGRGLSVLINPEDVAAVADGVVVNAVWAVGQMVARPRESRRAAADLDTAQWADSERLIGDALADVAAVLEISALSEQEAAELTAAIRRHEVQGALQALLAVRLTDAPEVEAVQARKAIQLALSGWVPPLPGTTDRRAPRGQGQPLRGVPLPGFETAGTRYAHRLSEYFDTRICGLVATLEGRVGFARLAQVRAEAYNARIVALLGAIERQVTALADPARDARDEAEFLDRYRRQAHQRHGSLTPPDFDRRRRVHVEDIYVPTRIKEEEYPERAAFLPGTEPGSKKVWDLVGLLDRTVLLGAPGGGKTTAANVLTDRFASDPDSRIPFLVTLREYAAKAPIEWSVAECIEQNMKTLYQCYAPDGLVERLLLTGRAVVVFDGLDELLDTSRRRNVSDRVEQFCSAYPLTQVLVTSRAVGYDQARLDDTQFTCYELAGFGDDEVGEYARKWFATQDGLPQAEAAAKAKAFLAESANAADLRTNPLLLSLMCILYRGAGSLPGDRAGIYARCAELLLRKWDEQRDLYRKLDADHLVEPTLRYLAWWLFTREDNQAVATERELIAKAAEFLYERGYETEEEARIAARGFVEFCRGRMWVFSDAGTAADGENLYGFTHRTFLEYFAAGHLAATSETPEQLALALAPKIGGGSWYAIGELAIQIRNSVTDRATDRIYVTLLDDHERYRSRNQILVFLATCVSSTRPSPATVRMLTRAILDHAFGSELRRSSDVARLLLAHSTRYERFVYEELTSRIATMVASGDPDSRNSALRFVLEMAKGFRHSSLCPWVDDQIRRYGAEVLDACATDTAFRASAVGADVISIEQALAMPGDLSVLVGDMKLIDMFHGRLMVKAPEIFDDLAAVGRFVAAHPRLPWVRAALYHETILIIVETGLLDETDTLDESAGLGLAAVIALSCELSDLPTFRRAYGLPEIPMPTRFKELFRDWAAERVNFAEILDE